MSSPDFNAPLAVSHRSSIIGIVSGAIKLSSLLPDAEISFRQFG
jgi:hypothetical protein